ncbi:Histone-lysine N-methyltransferase ATX3 [Holothuria leucospilota]|uniref:Histone-lysine N-methyltransferase ATX3 n=1 Tax=Holothuria leucospilota TaxID=206669 RepID=A0A9Q1CHB6_HOLLE|nr:Histone-lysine N-methyltransferase ATX3 [Holothuria leucospilota]
MCLLLILGGAIEVNPGPGFYCGVCSKLVKKRDKAVECDGCVKWVHTRCASIDNAEYTLLQLSNPDDKWYCPNCSSPCGICAQMVLGTDPAIE